MFLFREMLAARFIRKAEELLQGQDMDVVQQVNATVPEPSSGELPSGPQPTNAANVIVVAPQERLRAAYPFTVHHTQ